MTHLNVTPVRRWRRVYLLFELRARPAMQDGVSDDMGQAPPRRASRDVPHEISGSANSRLA